MSDYCYPDTDVLINKLQIRDQDKLRETERKLTALRIYDLIWQPVRRRFDLDHLCSIHGYIFQDVYSWAGKLREVNIAKGNMFCDVRFLRDQADHIFGEIRQDNYLENMSRERLVQRLAFHFSEINALHPFREGNGRTQREFIRELVLYNYYAIDFSKVTEDEMLAASVDSFL